MNHFQYAKLGNRKNLVVSFLNNKEIQFLPYVLFTCEQHLITARIASRTVLNIYQISILTRSSKKNQFVIHLHQQPSFFLSDNNNGTRLTVYPQRTPTRVSGAWEMAKYTDRHLSWYRERSSSLLIWQRTFVFVR